MKDKIIQPYSENDVFTHILLTYKRHAKTPLNFKEMQTVLKVNMENMMIKICSLSKFSTDDNILSIYNDKYLFFESVGYLQRYVLLKLGACFSRLW